MSKERLITKKIKQKDAREVYSEEFRETAIKLALAGNKSTAEVARELGLPEWKLYGWVQSWRKKYAKSTVPRTPIYLAFTVSEKAT